MRLNSPLPPLADFLQDGAALSGMASGHGVAARSALDRDERRRPAHLAIVGGRGLSAGMVSNGVTGTERIGEISAADRMPLLLKAGEVAQLLGISRSTAFALMASGELPVIRIRRSVRVPRDALYGWIRERTVFAGLART